MKRNKTNGLTLVMGLILGMLWMSSCKHDIPVPVVDDGNGGGGGGGGNNGIPCDSDSVYFNMQVLPFLVANCAQSGCHDVASHEDGVVITSYQTLMNSGIVTPGSAYQSDIIDVLTTSDPDDRMPPAPASPLTNAQIQLVRKWINQGALNLDCSGNCDTLNVTWSGTIQPLMQNKCQGCHQPNNAGGGIDLSNYAGVSGAAFDGSLLGSVQHGAYWSAMPKNSTQLPDCEIAQIRIWVDAGAPNN